LGARARIGGEPVADAAKAVLDEVRAMGGTGGVIVAAPDGSAAWHFTTPGMYRARLSSEGGREIWVFED
jgi:beta-aspartyl-peptidase (threonine type)